jgi:peptide/nickel transport system substrate-binding protein
MWIETEHLEFRPDLIHGNLFAEVDVNDDATEFTVKLREGMKFHNGADFDTEDVAFWWNEVILNTDLTPSPPAWARTGHNPQGTPGSIEVIDQSTFKWVFDGPYGSFIGRWDMYSGYNKFTDSDFLKQIHVDFADPDELAAKVEEQGFEEGEWTRLWGYYLNDNNAHITNVPRYHAWIPESNEATYRKMCRNPYYWKIDRWGQQLPYIDCVEQQTVIDSDAAAVELIAGNVDFIRRAVTAANLPLYTQYQEDGGYEVFIMNQHAGLGEVFLNLTYQDDMWQKYVGEFRFREALNLALDREFINESVYFGLHEMPVRWVPTVEFNPEEAIRIFEEEFGMTEMDADGCRLGEDGEPFKIPFEVAEYTGEEVPVGEMVTAFFNEIGICSTLKQIDSQLFQEMNGANLNRAFTWWWHFPRHPFQVTPDLYGVAWQKTYAPLWTIWWDYNMGGGKELDPDATDILTVGVEPPEHYQRMRNALTEMWATSFRDTEGINRIWGEIKGIIGGNLYFLPIVNPVRGPFIISADIGNNCDTDEAYAITCSWCGEWWYYQSLGE